MMTSCFWPESRVTKMSDIRENSKARVVATGGADVRGPLFERPGKRAIGMFLQGHGAGGMCTAHAALAKCERSLFRAPRH